MSLIRFVRYSLATVLSAACLAGCGADKAAPKSDSDVDVVQRDIQEYIKTNPPATQAPNVSSSAGQSGKNSAGESIAEDSVSSDYAP
jgi:hypothetical protein